MWIHLLITEQIDGANGTAVIRDTHDGYWTKRFLDQFERPTLEDTIQYINQEPEKVLNIVKGRVPIDYESLLKNVEYRINLAKSLMRIMNDKAIEEETITFLL